jgi:hypothetical protein
VIGKKQGLDNCHPVRQKDCCFDPATGGIKTGLFLEDISLYKELHAPYREKDHGDDLENHMDGEGQAEPILIAQKQRKVGYKEKADGADYQVDHRCNQSTLVFPSCKKEDDDNNEIDSQHQTERKDQLRHFHGYQHRPIPFLCSETIT